MRPPSAVLLRRTGGALTGAFPVVSQRPRCDMFIETRPTKTSSSARSGIFPSRQPIMSLLAELGWFGECQTTYMSALTGFVSRLGGFALIPFLARRAVLRFPII